MEPFSLLLILFLYLLGSFPTGVALSRWKYGIDVREMGSGNIGATNITRNFGWSAGVFTFLIDFLKGFLPIYYLIHFTEIDRTLISYAGIALVFGHCFSVFLKGRGGKGVATSLGCLAATAPIPALIAAIGYVITLVTVRISAVSSLVGVVLVLGMVTFTSVTPETRVLVYAIAVIVVIRHFSNIQRLIKGKP
jgi:glycerol-3-phosphate acyltransferase PlsY